MTYAKLENGQPVAAPNPLIHSGRKYYNPSGDVLSEAGYKPVEYSQPPEDEGYYAPHWEEQGGAIVQVWEAAELPELPQEEPMPSADPTEARLDEIELALMELAALIGGE